MYGKKILSLREKARMTRAEFAAYMGVSSTAVYKWETEQSQPNIEALQRMADLFCVTLDELCDYRPNHQMQDQNLTMMTRAFRRMTKEEQEKYLAVGAALFQHAFEENET